MAHATQDGQRIDLGFGGLKVASGDHIGHYYQHADECVSVATDFLSAGLGDPADKCVCIGEPDSLNRIHAGLESRGHNTAAAIRSGQLVLFTGHPTPGELRSRLLQELVGVPEQYRLLRWLGDMTWAFDQMATTETLMEWECTSNVNNFPGVFLCQYDLHRFPGYVIVDALKSHPLSIIGNTIYENPYYLEPDQFLEEIRSREPTALVMP